MQLILQLLISALPSFGVANLSVHHLLAEFPNHFEFESADWSRKGANHQDVF